MNEEILRTLIILGLAIFVSFVVILSDLYPGAVALTILGLLVAPYIILTIYFKIDGIITFFKKS